MRQQYLAGLFIVGVLALTGAGCSSSPEQSNGAKQPTAVQGGANKQPTAAAFSYTVLGLKFQSPVALTVADIGAEKDTVVSAGILETDNKLKFNAVFGFIDDAAKAAMTKEQALAYGKTTFMGSAKPATDKVSRVFFGQTVEGEKQESKIPAPATLESYLVELPSKKWLFVGVKYTGAMPKEEAEKIIESIVSTLAE